MTFIRYEDAETKEQAEDWVFDSDGWIPSVIEEVEGGWACFQYVDEYETWKKQL